MMDRIWPQNGYSFFLILEKMMDEAMKKLVTGFSFFIALCGSVMSVNAQDKADCSSLEAFSKSHGIGLQVLWFHGIYPMAAQSQMCSEETRITDAELSNYWGNFTTMFGCSADTPAHQELLNSIGSEKESDKLGKADIKKIPSRYLSNDPNFCDSDNLKKLKQCLNSVEACKKIMPVEGLQ